MVRLKELGKAEAERGQNSLESRSVFKIMPFQASDPLSVWVLADTTIPLLLPILYMLPGERDALVVCKLVLF